MSGENKSKNFYVSFGKRADDSWESCSVTLELPSGDEQKIDGQSASSADIQCGDPKAEFADVLCNFRAAMDGYRNFIPLTLWMVPHIAYQMGFQRIHRLSEEKGMKLEEQSDKKRVVFQLDIEHYRECSVLTEKMNISIDRAKHLPEVMLIGLISVYDAMLGRLLKVVFSKHEEIVLTSEKTLKFSELSSYGSIEAAKEALIDKEIESILRESHHKQFSWMESKFNIKLRENLPVWPAFIEVCERRNLITHTDGLVSAQYLASGSENKFDTSGLSIGDKLKVDPKYYAAAVNAVYEVGAKLCHVFWRKFSEKQREVADKELSDLGFSLIRDRNYELAEAILRFATGQRKHHSDKIRRMMVVNLANAVRLQDRQEEANTILLKEDWSAVGNDFQICVAAVKGDLEDVVRLMHVIGAAGLVGAEDYRTWPVFRRLRTNEKFTETFEAIFGSKFLLPKKSHLETVKELPPEASDSSLEQLEERAYLN